MQGSKIKNPGTKTINLKENSQTDFTQTGTRLPAKYAERIILFLFLCSGFSGLIYESIWSHYLKLLFGHAAYAQSLVLGIFMGGLALGAMLTSVFENRIKNPLLLYGIIEGVIGLFALFFHDIFLFTQSFIFETVAPSIDSAGLFSLAKWTTGSLLILPQSILLGTTFPLISMGILRIASDHPGKSFSLLYFNNSFGASLGALASGFLFIQHYGLPGTMLIAGILNIVIALMIFAFYAVPVKHQPLTTEQSKSEVNYNSLYWLLIATAFFTGLASFFYEIAWIRMLSLVLGSSAHAFELMISAFILGLGLGSLWIKKRIDSFLSPLNVLANIQVLMAIAALLSLAFYNQLFDLMEYVLKVVQRNSEGYSIYIFINHFMALIIMLPATFFAGMTLPLITHILYRETAAKKVISHVYAINTLGAITGIFLAVNILLPAVGFDGVVTLGALTDITIGLVILGFIMKHQLSRKNKFRFSLVTVISLTLFLIFPMFIKPDPLQLASGVFRTGDAKLADDTRVLFSKDGSLSTVSVYQTPKGFTTLTNNGKPEAGVQLYEDISSPDESTMSLLALIPMSFNNQLRSVANIGMGSGMTVNTVLGNPSVEVVDSIEIEESVIEALPYFKVYSQLVRYDQRSRIHIDDAKSYFSKTNKKYDLIISEPPNPWVSGVSSLFTTEFYKDIKKNINTKGIFAQWLQVYELDMKSIARIMQSLAENFNYYALFNTINTDIVILASDDFDFNLNNISLPESNQLNFMLRKIQVNSADAIKARYIGNKQTLSPLFASLNVAKNSDFYPVLAYEAGKSLFMKNTSRDLSRLVNYPVPVSSLLEGSEAETLSTLPEQNYFKSQNIVIANQVLKSIENDLSSILQGIPRSLAYSLNVIKSHINSCQPVSNKLEHNLLSDALFVLAKITTPNLGNKDLKLLWSKINGHRCFNSLPASIKEWAELHRSIALRHHQSVIRLAQIKLKSRVYQNLDELSTYLLTSLLTSALITNDNVFFKQYQKLLKGLAQTENIPLVLRLVLSHTRKKYSD